MPKANISNCVYVFSLSALISASVKALWTVFSISIETNWMTLPDDHQIRSDHPLTSVKSARGRLSKSLERDCLAEMDRARLDPIWSLFRVKIARLYLKFELGRLFLWNLEESVPKDTTESPSRNTGREKQPPPVLTGRSDVRPTVCGCCLWKRG